MDLLNFLLPDYGRYTIWTAAFQALAGMIGLTSRLSVENTLLLCPSKAADGVRLGTLGLMIAAGAVGLLVDHNPALGWIVGTAAPEIIRVIMKAAPTVFERLAGVTANTPSQGKGGGSGGAQP